MEPNQDKLTLFYNKCPAFSLFAGLLALTSCCYPPVQLVLGAAAVLMAYLSKNSGTMTSQAKIGTVLGVISICTSVLIFAQFVFAMHLMEDPANASLIKEVYRQYEEFFNSITAQ
ncbi:MAG: hypothetical protein PHV18_16225 [Lachnospiraceae bacterium]|nr:hypothetical protein [Lachnospiraceae bacterium]